MRMKTRFWDSDQGSSTCVQYRDDAEPMVWMHTNLGWVPIGNSPEDAGEAEAFAVETAKGYGLVERDNDTARAMAGVE